jgi:hypothetical protein
VSGPWGAECAAGWPPAAQGPQRSRRDRRQGAAPGCAHLHRAAQRHLPRRHARHDHHRRRLEDVRGPVTRDDFHYGESYDARKQIAGWDIASFDDSAWKTVPIYAPVAKPGSLALNKPVTALEETACDGWSRAALVDGIDMSTDQSEGYHSGIASTAATTKWVQVDLGSAHDIAGITLFPAHPTNDTAGDFPGAGFPVRYRVQVSDDPDFGTATTVVDHTDSGQSNAGTTPVTITASVTGRYVRITATVLQCRDTSCTFRLAELGVYGPHPTTTFGLTHLEADTTPRPASSRPSSPSRRPRPQTARLARGLVNRCRELTLQIKELTTEITVLVLTMAPALIAIPGCGAITAAKILGEAAGVDRLRSKDAFTRHTGTAPMPVWSSNKARHRLRRTGNRQLNAALHRIELPRRTGTSRRN